MCAFEDTWGNLKMMHGKRHEYNIILEGMKLEHNSYRKQKLEIEKNCDQFLPQAMKSGGEDFQNWKFKG